MIYFFDYFSMFSLALTLSASSCTDTHQTAASTRVDISRVCCFFPSETKSKHRRLTPRREDTYTNKGLKNKILLPREGLDTALKCAVMIYFKLLF